MLAILFLLKPAITWANLFEYELHVVRVVSPRILGSVMGGKVKAAIVYRRWADVGVRQTPVPS